MENASVKLPLIGNEEDFFRIEKFGKIRLLLRDKNPILIGHFKKGLLVLNKNKENYGRMSYSFAVPIELWRNLQSKLEMVAIYMRKANKYYYAPKNSFVIYGYEDDVDRGPQNYLYLDANYWEPADGLHSISELVRDSNLRIWRANEKDTRTEKQARITGRGY